MGSCCSKSNKRRNSYVPRYNFDGTGSFKRKLSFDPVRIPTFELPRSKKAIPIPSTTSTTEQNNQMPSSSQNNDDGTTENAYATNGNGSTIARNFSVHRVHPFYAGILPKTTNWDNGTNSSCAEQNVPASVLAAANTTITSRSSRCSYEASLTFGEEDYQEHVEVLHWQPFDTWYTKRKPEAVGTDTTNNGGTAAGGPSIRDPNSVVIRVGIEPTDDVQQQTQPYYV